ncbi:hypothetical protein SASPL_107619 [Salvia splendens]|uniref:Uncharacterized protein n=1 Tax=Salvia splendens TaxID=180675 RepID=A0A8X9A5G7_SALSN|nr:uncharacterized protein LOC121796517 [Salvia splendens]KAG6429567.1 hypothetical protein SASPL_107619 [Salvia splendens]
MQTQMSQDFLTHLKLSSDEKGLVDVKFEENQADVEHRAVDEEEVEEDEEEEEEEFSFMCGGANTSPIAAEDAFINGHIKPVFPLFSRDLLFYGEDPAALHDNLPMRPPVKVFVETAGGATSSAAETERAAGPSCDWSDRKAVEASPEVCKKSNSTGFSKIWRFKDLLGRSNSDGRDAFVFLNNSHAMGGEKCEKKEAVKVSGKSKKGGKVKTAPLSAHEVYLKSKAKGEERRRSYLPYRPELMGFFTNVNGGLSKNVHPF